MGLRAFHFLFLLFCGHRAHSISYQVGSTSPLTCPAFLLLSVATEPPLSPAKLGQRARELVLPFSFFLWPPSPLYLLPSWVNEPVNLSCLSPSILWPPSHVYLLLNLPTFSGSFFLYSGQRARELVLPFSFYLWPPSPLYLLPTWASEPSPSYQRVLAILSNSLPLAIPSLAIRA